MKLQGIYKLAVKMGIEKDVRDNDNIQRLLNKCQMSYEKLEDKDRDFFDTDTLFNPFADTRILYGSGEEEIRTVICGVDME
ncbi:MAG: NGG1p interacting factor NIF3, partial [Ignavibacteriales bacterium]